MMHQTSGFNGILDVRRYKEISKHFRKTDKRVLEIGNGSGDMTKKLLKRFEEVATIDPESRFQGNVKKHAHYPYSVEYTVGIGTFDLILVCNVLEHTPDWNQFLKHIMIHFTKKTTRLIFTVPNAKSANRLNGVGLGMLDHPHSLSKADRSVSHKRVYYVDILRNQLDEYFKIKEIYTYIWKPFTNKRMIGLDKKLQRFCLTQTNLKEYGAEILAVARKR